MSIPSSSDGKAFKWPTVSTLVRTVECSLNVSFTLAGRHFEGLQESTVKSMKYHLKCVRSFLWYELPHNVLKHTKFNVISHLVVEIALTF